MGKNRWRAELGIASVLVVFSLLALEESLRMPVLGKALFEAPGFTPSVISVILLIMSLYLVLAIVGWRSKLTETDVCESESKGYSLKRLFATVGLIIGYVLLLGRMDYMWLTFLFILLFMTVFRTTKTYKIVLLAVTVSWGLTYIFGNLMGVPLP